MFSYTYYSIQKDDKLYISMCHFSRMLLVIYFSLLIWQFSESFLLKYISYKNGQKDKEDKPQASDTNRRPSNIILIIHCTSAMCSIIKTLHKYKGKINRKPINKYNLQHYHHHYHLPQSYIFHCTLTH